MRIHTCLHLSAALAAALLVASCEKYGAQAEKTPGLGSQQIESLEDGSFLLQAERAEIRQITFCELAMHKATNQDIRDFARSVITSHSNALTHLRDLMTAKKLGRPQAEGEAIALEAKNRLDRVSGSAFDAEFVSLMTADQQESLARFNSTAETAADPNVRHYAQTVLPSMRREFDSVVNLQMKLPKTL